MRIRTVVKNKYKIIFSFLAVIILSCILRPHLLNSNLADDEWHNATVLRHLQIWDKVSPWGYKFNPSVTYPGAANKFIDNHASLEKDFSIYSDNKNNYYYISYPQFGYIMPYLFFKTLFLKPNAIGLRVFGILIQMCIALFICTILYNITKEIKVGFVGFMSFMLLPITQYYYAYNYMSDMLVPLFYLSTVYFFLKIVSEEKVTSLTKLFLILSLILTIYTEYIGIFLAGVIFLYTLKMKNQNYKKFIIWTCILVPILTMSLVVYQYLLVGSFDSFFAVIFDRYSRGYIGRYPSKSSEIIKIFGNYWEW